MYSCKYDCPVRFEWDEEKNQLNIRKHGIDFNDVPEMFRQPMLALRDERFEYPEARGIGMGWINAWVSVVAYTERQGDVIRIISARRATRREVTRLSKPSISCEQDQAPVDTSDIPELDDDFFRRAELRVPAKQTVTIRLDADVLAWFKEQGAGYQTRINQLLRQYMQAQQRR